MKSATNIVKRRALSAEEFSAQFRRNPDHERLYRESEARLDLAERMVAITSGVHHPDGVVIGT